MKKLSLILIAILLSGIAPLLSAHSQPNGCININGIKTPELIAQFETWLNEPDGLNERFLDGTESSFERGQRLFYNLVLNNNQICISDLTKEMIDSIMEVIRSYDNADNHFYIVDGLQVSREEISLGFKAIRDPVILGKRISLFAEAIQIIKPIDDSFVSDLWSQHNIIFTQECSNPASACWEHINSNFGGGATEDLHSDINPIVTNEEGVEFNNTGIIDPQVSTGHNLNITYAKDSAAGRQIDINFTVTQSENGTIIKSHIQIDVTDTDTNALVSLSGAEADSITNYNDLFGELGARAVGGGAGRFAVISYFTLEIPDPPIDNPPTIADPTLWGLFNTTDTIYSILSFDGWDKVFQDQQIRLNLTVTDQNGRNNITQVHANFNSTTFVLSFYNDSGTFVFNTTTPLIVENLEGTTQDITNGFNITFIFSLSSELVSGYYWLTNANVTDDNTNSTLVRERWFSFIQQAGAGGGGLTQLSLSPIGPQIMLIFLVIGLIALGQSNPWFVLAGWVSMFVAFGLMLTGQYYVGVDSSDNFLSFNQFFPEEFNVWLLRFFIAMQFIYPFRILALIWERVINVTSSLRERFA